MVLFEYLRSTDNALDLHSPLSQVIPLAVISEVNNELKKV